MSPVRSDCMYAWSYNLHSTNSQISVWIKYRFRHIFIQLFSALIRFHYLRSPSIVSLASKLQVNKALASTPRKTYRFHELTKFTPASLYCEPMDYFTNWNQLNNGTYLPMPSNNPSLWTHHSACKLNKG